MSYYRKGDGFESEYDPVVQASRVLDPGPLITNYPHAGILNTTVFLRRYPTTATNRNRARARWTYYHFLGVDVEKSASRTADPVALADTNNPTMHNPACTVCHSVLDPVAGAFQNYGDDGFYRDQWDGMDSLDDLYKNAVTGDELAVYAESWAERETLVWQISLGAGATTLGVVFTNPFCCDGTEDQGQVYLDRLRIVEPEGQVLVSREFEDLEVPIGGWGGPCGEVRHNPATEHHDYLWLHWGELQCMILLDVEAPSDGVYELRLWLGRNRPKIIPGVALPSCLLQVDPYEEGDTWYRDMRIPGFDGVEAHRRDTTMTCSGSRSGLLPTNALPKRPSGSGGRPLWAARSRSLPQDAADAGFEGQLLAASAQDAEVLRLANGFRDGFPGSPHKYNLKDLLVEIVLSKWFRADAVTDTDSVRRVALRSAGARRLLTPEELARKTAALTGVQWGRGIGTGCWPICEQRRPVG